MKSIKIKNICWKKIENLPNNIYFFSQETEIIQNSSSTFKIKKLLKYEKYCYHNKVYINIFYRFLTK